MGAEHAGDRFDPFRCGLDHLSFGVPSKADLEAAVQAFEERGVEHGGNTDMPPFGIAVLPLKDPTASRWSPPPRSSRCRRRSAAPRR